MLLVTAYADVKEPSAPMRDGALNYLTKPIDLDGCSPAVSKSPAGGEGARARAELIAARKRDRAQSAMQLLFRDTALMANRKPALITGGGVGKEVLADLIHLEHAPMDRW